MGIHHKYFYKLYILTFKISTLGFSFLVLSGLRPVWRVSVGNSCCHPVLDAALGLQLDQILLVGQLSRCRLLIQPQSSFCCSSTQCFVPIWPDPRDFQFHLGVSLSPVYFGDRLSCFLISLLCGFPVLVSLLPFSQWQLYQSIYFLNIVPYCTNSKSSDISPSTAF